VRSADLAEEQILAPRSAGLTPPDDGGVENGFEQGDYALLE
jgi:hypothetical protein